MDGVYGGKKVDDCPHCVRWFEDEVLLQDHVDDVHKIDLTIPPTSTKFIFTKLNFIEKFSISFL